MFTRTQLTIGGPGRRAFCAQPGRRTLMVAVATLAAASGLFTSAARAQVAATAGDAEATPRATVLAAGSVAENMFESDAKIRVILERENVELAAAAPVDILAEGTYGLPLTPGGLPAGTTLTSVLVHVDRVTSVGSTHYHGKIEFNADVVAVVVTDANLDAWDPLVGLPAIAYPAGVAFRGLELASTPDVVDEIALAGRTLELDFNNTIHIEQIRVLLAVTPRGVSFSIDAQGPSYGAAATFGAALMSAGSVLTTGAAGAPGPNPAVPGPTVAPGVMLTPAALGIANPGAAGVREVDALSFGHDRGDRLLFSVDEFAVGGVSAVTPDVRSEGALPGANLEAAADVFAYRGPIAPTAPGFTPANRASFDGDGIAPSGRDGFGLIEPNPPTVGATPDPGDNLDAFDLGTTAAQLAGFVYFSLDAPFADWAETGASPPNFGTAPANGFSAADILVTVPGSGVVNVYVTAAALGLNCGGACRDDVDALALWDDGDGIYDPAVDRVLFSLRRGSGSLGMLDGRLGLPITEADVLTPGPDILIPGESLGLNTARSGWLPPTGVPDDLDALDRVQARGGPVANPDNPNLLRGALEVIDVLANDVALVGQVLPATVMIFSQPEHGSIVAIDPLTGKIGYQHDNSATTEDTFSYVVFDNAGECSEPTTVSLRINLTGVSEGGHLRSRTLLSFAGPNPFSTSTAFMLRPAQSGRVTVAVYDMAGRRVRTLLDETVTAGESRQIAWDGRDENRARAAASMYFVRMRSLDGEQLLPVIRLK